MKKKEAEQKAVSTKTAKRMHTAEHKENLVKANAFAGAAKSRDFLLRKIKSSEHKTAYLPIEEKIVPADALKEKHHEEHTKEKHPQEHAKEKQSAKNVKQKEIVQSEVNIGTIGHVDHGKTTLVRALTGKWCDTHSEEMKRGISIRLGYADAIFYKLKTDSGTTYNNKPEYSGQAAQVIGKRNISFVDAPGHETLMTTMLSGAALMNGAVLVVAANETCPQPRTIEHLMALKFAGVDKVVVAQNKVDLVTKEKALENYKSIRNFLDSYGYKDAPIIPTSANFGVNIDALIEAIETHIPTPHFDLSKPLKMFIARSFDINKPSTRGKDIKGAIIGGSITCGTVTVGDEIELGPGLGEGFTKTKVLSIATDEGLLQTARAGGLIAIGTDLDPSIGQNDRLRGQIAAKVGTLSKPVKELHLSIQMFERMTEQNIKDRATKQTGFVGRNEADDSSRKVVIKVTDPIVVTIGTNTTVGFVTKIDSKKCVLNLKNEVIAEKNEKVAVSKNINGQWRLVAYGEVI